MNRTPPAVVPLMRRFALAISARRRPGRPARCSTWTTTYVSTRRTSTDRLRPERGGSNPRAAAESIYSADFKRIVGGPEIRTVNRFTFEQDHKYLLPRAVAYSASLIDYIFRGEMEIKPPAEGVYAVVDSSPAGCDVPCGFRKLRLKLRNTTPGDEIMDLACCARWSGTTGTVAISRICPGILVATCSWVTPVGRTSRSRFRT